jgi:hypothetical protein
VGSRERVERETGRKSRLAMILLWGDGALGISSMIYREMARSENILSNKEVDVGEV